MGPSLPVPNTYNGVCWGVPVIRVSSCSPSVTMNGGSGVAVGGTGVAVSSSDEEMRGMSGASVPPQAATKAPAGSAAISRSRRRRLSVYVVGGMSGVGVVLRVIVIVVGLRVSEDDGREQTLRGL